MIFLFKAVPVALETPQCGRAALLWGLGLGVCAGVTPGLVRHSGCLELLTKLSKNSKLCRHLNSEQNKNWG